MHRATQKEREEFVSLIAQHAGDCQEMTSFRFARILMRYGATLGRIAENQCNGYDRTGRGDYDAKWAEKDSKKEQRIQVKIGFLCAKFGCTPLFQGDPRGATVKIQVPDGYTNDWGKVGICVPTS